MSYRVVYDKPGKKRRGTVGYVAAGLILCFLLVGLLWPQGAQTLRTALTPGDPAVTTAALEQFAGDLRAGTGFSQALERMCRTILWEGIRGL